MSEQHEELILRGLCVAFQSERVRVGFADDLRWAASTCRGAWREEQIWNGLVNVRRGVLKRTHLMYAAAKGDAARVRWLLDRGAQVGINWRDADGNTALHHAVDQVTENVEVVRLLLDAGALPNVHNNAACRGRTPLIAAAARGQDSVITALLDSGAIIDLEQRGWTELDAQTATRETAIVSACLAKHASSVKILIDRGASVAARIRGACLLEIAVMLRRKDVETVLRGAGMKCDQWCNRGFSPHVPDYVHNHYTPLGWFEND